MRKVAKNGAAGVALGLLLAGAAGAQDGLAPDQLYEKVSPSVWTVHTFGADNKPLASGSGVVVGAGSVVTNCHVLKQASRIGVDRDNVSYGATLESSDAERDLCLLKIRNFTAPAVTVADPNALKVGARVYAIGSPRGQEQTLADGMLAGLRRTADGELSALQVTAPLAAGSSGGGLFDARGRLIGITSFALREGPTQNFALPATWIAQMAQRAQPARAAAAVSAAVAAPAAPAAAPSPVAAGNDFNVFEYRLTDRMLRKTRTVIYRVDKRSGDRLVMNGGTRVEEAGGRVVSDSGLAGGEFDQAMPPGGWLHAGLLEQGRWKTKYSAAGDGRPYLMDLSAEPLGEEVFRLQGRELRALRYRFKGYTTRGGTAATNPPGAYTAMVWFAPELGRVVRFEARTRGGVGGTVFVVYETLELVDARTE